MCFVFYVRDSLCLFCLLMTWVEFFLRYVCLSGLNCYV